ncbi:hypothetical protein Leucomu_10620 [Leucobacter muris]|uniref:DUF2993 domain-containing protein n=1 Tax=Leucobacter muris TaxID=1935379 RepID=A0ABX5QH05_9MICO|nr:hypothetical protein [Leucobacter muris]QAB18310.1 hypothetical protein Leucomu_10620 [Leucobacter muris]
MSERESRWWPRLLGVVVAVVLLGGAAEVALRLIVPDTIRGAARVGLRLTVDHPVEVSMGGSALLNAFRGGVGDVTVTVPDAPLIEGVKADATVHASLVPFNPMVGEIRDASVSLRVDRDQLGPVVNLVTQGVAQTGEVRDGSLVVGRSIEIFGQEVPLSASLGVAVAGAGEIEIEPRGVTAAGLDLSTEQLAQAAGGLLDPLLQPQVLCVRDQLPRGVALTGITLSSTGSATISADLAPGIVSDERERLNGSCSEE